MQYKNLLNIDPELITDKYNDSEQVSEFIENRHDQSLFSLLSKVIGSEVIPNETEFRKNKSKQYNYPFLSVRYYGHGPKDYARYFLNPKKFTKNTVFFS